MEEYVRRMEAAVLKANAALMKLVAENKSLKVEIQRLTAVISKQSDSGNSNSVQELVLPTESTTVADIDKEILNIRVVDSVVPLEKSVIRSQRKRSIDRTIQLSLSATVSATSSNMLAPPTASAKILSPKSSRTDIRRIENSNTTTQVMSNINTKYRLENGWNCEDIRIPINSPALRTLRSHAKFSMHFGENNSSTSTDGTICFRIVDENGQASLRLVSPHESMNNVTIPSRVGARVLLENVSISNVHLVASTLVHFPAELIAKTICICLHSNLVVMMAVAVGGDVDGSISSAASAQLDSSCLLRRIVELGFPSRILEYCLLLQQVVASIASRVLNGKMYVQELLSVLMKRVLAGSRPGHALHREFNSIFSSFTTSAGLNAENAKEELSEASDDESMENAPVASNINSYIDVDSFSFEISEADVNPQPTPDEARLRSELGALLAIDSDTDFSDSESGCSVDSDFMKGQTEDEDPEIESDPMKTSTISQSNAVLPSAINPCEASMEGFSGENNANTSTRYSWRPLQVERLCLAFVVRRIEMLLGTAAVDNSEYLHKLSLLWSSYRWNGQHMDSIGMLETVVGVFIAHAPSPANASTMCPENSVAESCRRIVSILVASDKSSEGSANSNRFGLLRDTSIGTAAPALCNEVIRLLDSLARYQVPVGSEVVIGAGVAQASRPGLSTLDKWKQFECLRCECASFTDRKSVLECIGLRNEVIPTFMDKLSIIDVVDESAVAVPDNNAAAGTLSNGCTELVQDYLNSFATKLISLSEINYWHTAVNFSSSADGAFRIIGEVLSSILDTDFENGKWIGGSSGQGQVLTTRFEGKFDSANKTLLEVSRKYSDNSTIAGASHARPKPFDIIAASTDSHEATAWQTSFSFPIPTRLVAICCTMDRLSQALSTCCDWKALNSHAVDADVDAIMNKLSHLHVDFSFLLRVFVFEKFLEVAAAAASSAICNGVKLIRENVSNRSEDILNVVRAASRFFYSLPRPWGQASDLAVVTAIQEALVQYSCRALMVSPRSMGPGCPQKSMEWAQIQHKLSSEFAKLPVFVVNLHRRCDRWNSMLVSCDDAGLYPIRMDAVDAATLQPSHIASSISETDVAAHWNTSLYRQFDYFCPQNDNLPMSLSERACAASHLRVWRMISAMRRLLQKGNLEKPNNASHDILLEHQAARVFTASYYCHSWTALTLQKPNPQSKGSTATNKRRGSGQVVSQQPKPYRRSAIVQQSEQDWYVICEDDCMFPPAIGSRSRFADSITSLIVNQIPADFDIVFLYSSVPPSATAVPFAGGSFRMINYTSMMCAYVLRGRAIELLLSRLPITAPLDLFIGELLFDGVLKGYAITEPSIKLADVKTTGRSDVVHSGRSIPGRWPKANVASQQNLRKNAFHNRSRRPQDDPPQHTNNNSRNNNNNNHNNSNNNSNSIRRSKRVRFSL